MEKIIKKLLKLDTEDRRVYEFKPGYRTIVPKNKLTEQQWINEFRFGIQYGKSAVHFG